MGRSAQEEEKFALRARMKGGEGAVGKNIMWEKERKSKWTFLVCNIIMASEGGRGRGIEPSKPGSAHSTNSIEDSLFLALRVVFSTYR